MGAVLSCLGLKSESDNTEHSRLLPDDPFNQSNNNYGSWIQSPIQPQNTMSQEEVHREQEAMDNIMRWASDQIVDIFPHQHRNLAASTQQLNSAAAEAGMSASAHQDIILSMIPGDKSKRSIRIYPASRPSSAQDGNMSLKSKDSRIVLNGSARSESPNVFVKLKVDLP